jgi:RHS repeat-associated protein
MPSVMQLESIETPNLLLNPIAPVGLNPLAWSPKPDEMTVSRPLAAAKALGESTNTGHTSALIPALSRNNGSTDGGSSSSHSQTTGESFSLAKGEMNTGAGQWTIWSPFDGGMPSIASHGGGGIPGGAPSAGGAAGAAGGGASSGAAGGGTTGPGQAMPISPPSGPSGGGGGSAPAPQTHMGPLVAPPAILTGGGGNVPSIMPVLHDSTAADPQRELIQVSQGAQGGNPMSQAFSQSGVRYADGAIQLDGPDLTSTAFGNPFGQTRSWTNIGGYASASYLGNGWVQNQSIFLQQQNSGLTLALVSSDTNAKFFDLNIGTGVWTERYFLQDTLTDNTTTHIITVVDNTGKAINFYDFNSANPTAEQGAFQSITDQFGDTTSVTAHNANNQIQEIQSSSTVGSTTVTESYLYTYVSSGSNAGYLQNVTLRRQTNGGAWSNVRQVAYAYYTTGSSFGNTGDLETAQIEDGSGNVLDTYLYRYYTSTVTGGFKDGLQYAFDPSAYERLAAAYSNPLTATNAQASPYATDGIQYNSNKTVSQITVAGDGSSLASSNFGLGTYSFTYTTSSFGTGANNWHMETLETLPDSSTNTVFTNAYGEVMLKAYTSGSNTWLWFNKYDSSERLIESAQPSAVNGYSTSYADLLHFSSGSYQYLNNTTGLITLTTYYTSTTATSTTGGGVSGDYEETQVEQGQNGTAVETAFQQYYKVTATVNSVSVTVTPVASDEVFSQTNGTGGRTTSYSYTWFTNSTVAQSETVTKPVISSGENGPGAADTEVTFFSTLALPIWHKNGDGFLTYAAYDQATSAVAKTINDVNTADSGDFSNLPSGWTTPSGGGLELITTMQVDGLDRTTKLTDPNANVTYTVFNDTNHEKLVYPGWNSSTNMPTGPTQVSRNDLGGSYSETLTMSATPHLTGGVPDGTEAISSIQTLSRTYVNIAGQAVRKDDYFNLSGVTYSTANYIGTQNTNFYTSLNDYDARGWLTRIDSPTGTITRIVNDGLGRRISIWVGTNDTPGSGSWSPTNNTSPSNMVQTKSYQYDSGGVGDSDMTQETDYPGGSAANRVNQFYFDWRDRLVASKQGVQASESDGTNRPIIYKTLDNLGEVTEQQLFDGDGVSITSTNGVPNAPSSSLLRAETVTNVDDQGRVYQTLVYDVNQSTGSVSSTALTTNDYYNHRGQLIEESVPAIGGPGVANAGSTPPIAGQVSDPAQASTLGTVTKDQFDGAGRKTEQYTTDGASGSGWSNASSVSSDNVLEQVDTTYDSDGNAIMVTDRQRNHNTSTTGALGNETTSPKARVYYSTAYFDAANRVIDTVNVGTNGGSAYTRPSSPPSSSATVLVTVESYNAAGWVNQETDPRGIVKQTSYDNLGRVTQTIEDYTNGTPTATTNKTTNFTYDGDNHMLTLQAVEVSGSETTQWNYGVTTGSGSNLNSNDILASVEYPSPSTGAASTSYEEVYTVNALGDNLTFTDRAGNVHTYSYDVLGRQTADAVMTLATGFDNTVLRIQTAYNALGNPYLISSYNAATGGSIVNQVELVYNGLDQLATDYQSHSGAVTIGTTPVVQYTYTEMSGGVNNSRLTTITYPDSYAVTLNYASGIDTTISRLTSLSDSNGTLEAYLYLGVATVVQRTRAADNMEMTYISQTGGTGDAGDQYSGLDRFGRVVEQNWYNTSTTTSTDDFQYGYDQNSNVLWKNNILDSVFSELYHASGSGNGYDNLNQLSAFARGTLSASGGSGTPLDTVSSPSETESWSPDALGNFSSMTLNGTQTNRTNNQQNETTAVSSNNLTFDTNGNTTTDDLGHTFVYDAWNRAVAVKSSGTTIASYAYDGLGRRIQQTETGMTTDIYFDANWRNVAEQVSGAAQARYVWSPIDQDALVLRDDQPSGGSLTRRFYVQQDANWNVTSIANTSGSVVERYVYDPYGAVTYLTASWGSLSASAYSWQYLFQVGRLDAKSGLYIFEHRDYSPTLGRWMEVDPLKYKAGDVNCYRFVANSPSEHTDTSGEVGLLLLFVAACVVGAAWPSNTSDNGEPSKPTPYDPQGAAVVAGAGLVVIAVANGGGLCIRGATYAWNLFRLGVGSQAVVAPGLGAGTYPALMVNGTIYVARFHAVCWEMAGGAGTVQIYGIATVGPTGIVIRWVYQ